MNMLHSWSPVTFNTSAYPVPDFTVTTHAYHHAVLRENSCGMIEEATPARVRVTLEAGDATVTLLVDADEASHPALRLGAVWTLTPPA